MKRASPARLRVRSTARRQVIDITDEVVNELPDGAGVMTVFVAHTTAAVATADLDPGTDADLLEFLWGIVPRVRWRHPHDPSHAPDHLLASLVGPSVSIPYDNGKLLLGMWQRVILIEFDGPRERDLTVICS